MTLVTTPTDVRSDVSWMHGKLVTTVGGADGIDVAVLLGAFVGVVEGCMLVAAPGELLAPEAAGSSDGAFVGWIALLTTF
jgi:hypothetical protein